ncbi:MAG: HrpE/YscL family type III secretion apparatus protein [Planctomycetota bacterium]
MGGTIEAFVEKLHTDGVEAGQAAAETIRAEAEEQAGQIIADARAQAERIIADAEAQCENLRLRSETELKLAVRDTVLRLRETLERALRHVLSAGVRQLLDDAGFLQELLRDLVSQYVKADIEGAEAIQVNVSKEMQQKLAHWAIETIRAEHEAQGPLVELRGSLAVAGFEYSIAEGTSEITVESVVHVLSDLVNTELREILAGAVSEEGS